MHNRKNGEKIGETTGRSREVDVEEDDDAYICIKIGINTNLPPRQGFWLKEKQNPGKCIGIKYNYRLSNLYYGCGEMGHEARWCDSWVKQENFHGVWLRDEKINIWALYSETVKRKVSNRECWQFLMCSWEHMLSLSMYIYFSRVYLSYINFLVYIWWCGSWEYMLPRVRVYTDDVTN